MSKKRSSQNINVLVVSIIVSLLGLVSGLSLVGKDQTLESFAESFTQPVLYFIPTEVTVPVNSTGHLYDLIIDTSGYEINGAIFEINYDPNLVQITDILEGEVLNQVISKSVSGGTAYLTVVTEEDKPFIGQGIVATVVFTTLNTPATTEFVFGNNTQIHTKTTTGGLPDDTPPGYINIVSDIPVSPTPTEYPTPSNQPTPTTNLTPTPTSTPTPTAPPETVSLSIHPTTETKQAEEIISSYVNIQTSTDGISEISLINKLKFDYRNPDVNIDNISIDPFFVNSLDWECTIIQPYTENHETFWGGTCQLVNSKNFLYPGNTTFLTFDIQGLGITYSVPLAISVDTSKSHLKDTNSNDFQIVQESSTSYYFCGTDYNNDGRSSLLDYAVWAYYFDPLKHVTEGPTVGDFNCDGYVTGLDYSLWAYNFSPI
ncbi:hypothetical protein JXA63_00360 [Candidatus Woesebacteria bacterium]|nr:hypothetical protein [Candidatus Woesebacteria bacterium]